MYAYSIMPLTEGCFEDVCKDIVEQYRSGVCTVPLFMMVLVPEGNPVWNKVDAQCKIYARYRDVLEPQGIQTGVLIQACLGHGYPIVANPYQRFINFTDGKTENYCCPEDPGVIEHFKDVIRKVAQERPSVIMLDDDVRLIMRPGRGCACPLHMKKFHQLTGCDMSREELFQHVRTHSSEDPLALKFIEMQKDSLVNFVTELREVIDSIDPTIQGINCTSGDECDSVIYTNPIFAGKGNPTMVRAGNGIYSPNTVHGFSHIMCKSAVAAAKLKKNGIDIVLSETDTIPYNRYGKNSRYLHSQYTASILEGMMGAKHWITRFSGYELYSGKAYREILAKHAKFYEKLSELADGIRWVGANSMFLEQKHHVFCRDTMWRYHANDWATCVFERLGLPFFFSDETEGAIFLEHDIVRDMTDEQIEKLFEKSVFASSEAAADLIDRGYGNLLGVDVRNLENVFVSGSLAGIEAGGSQGVFISGESFDGTTNLTCTEQKQLKMLYPTNEKVEVLSYNYTLEKEEVKIVSPAVTVYEREPQKLSVVYCGVPKTVFSYLEAFSFLNETRKKQFITLLSRAGQLPVYYPGDNEICFRAGHLKDGRLLTAVFDLGYDPMDTLELYLEQKPSSIKILQPDGSEGSVKWEAMGNDIYSVDVRIEPLYPVVLLIAMDN